MLDSISGGSEQRNGTQFTSSPSQYGYRLKCLIQPWELDEGSNISPLRDPVVFAKAQRKADVGMGWGVQGWPELSCPLSQKTLIVGPSLGRRSSIAKRKRCRMGC